MIAWKIEKYRGTADTRETKNVPLVKNCSLYIEREQSINYVGQKFAFFDPTIPHVG